ncbi:mechanosensitive ion channel domain-containing protein [Roseimarinus sediminis]|uniref:mechanosensitive ion channel domain-containing protein n=1 Tax=Roseimarinus sediminis TaxID=1610899 RepID=UPI003D250449
METMFEILRSMLKPAVIVFIIALLLVFNSWIFKRFKSDSSTGNIIRRSVALLIVLTGLLIFLLSLPIDKTTKGQILSLLGIIISAGIALSSTTILGNMIAGFMNSSMKRFRNGDLINIGAYTGRVTRKSIFHTELQLEDSNFITIPNLFIAGNIVKLTRKSNSVISTEVSLGYDIERSKIEEALKEAALATGLTDPYVYITNLGDYSVVYKIHGFLDDSNKFFSTRSLLNAMVMDHLHKSGIEIVSPTFMNQRRIDEKTFIPYTASEDKSTTTAEEATPEELIFDEAIKSEAVENKRDYIKKIQEKQEALKAKLKDAKNTKEKDQLSQKIERYEKEIGKIQQHIEQSEKEAEKEKK